MSDKTTTLTLKPSGKGGYTPDWNPWKPPKGSKVKIDNQTGTEQELTNISKGLLNPSPRNTVLVPVNGWSGTVGKSKGTYQYEDGLDDDGVRDGTIDPSGQNDDVPGTQGVRSGTIDP